MAAGKNTIVVYKDWINVFDSLRPEEAGLLIQHFFRYVNDLNPEPPDRLTQLLFEPMKAALKRDLVKWEGTKEVKSDSGLLGNLKRWHKDLHEKVLKKEIDMNEAWEIAKSRTPIKKVAKIAVSVSDSVSVINKKVNTCPSELEFLEYCKSLLQDKYLPLEFSLKAKYKSWVEAGWKDGNGKSIKNWKTKISNVIPYLKPMQVDPDKKQQTTNW